MTGPAVVQNPPHILTGDEWEQSQYGPQRQGQDPTKPMPAGRILTGDEWEKGQAAGSFKTLTFPAMPKIASDATNRLNPNSGAPDATVGGFVRNVSGALDVAGNANAFGAGGDLVAHGLAAVGRQVVAPAAEHPLIAGAMMNPIGGIIGLGMAAHTVAKYGWQAASEHFMSPEDRAKAEADPDRVSGEAAAVQAVMLGLGFMAGIHGVVSKAADVSEGVTEAGAKGMQPYFESPKGAEVLGTAAAAHGLPPTASPFPPETPLDAAWKAGHDATTQAAAPSAATSTTGPTTAPTLTARPAAALYGRLSDDALSAEYRALLEQRTTEQPNAEAPLWTPEREAQAVEDVENRRRPDGSFAVADQRQLDRLQLEQGEGYYVGRHTPESAAADRRLTVINRHIAAIETEMAGRGIKPEEAMQAPASGGTGAAEPIEGTGEVKTRGLSAGVESKAVAHGMDPLDVLPEYRSVNMEDQAAKATDLLTKNPELARQIATGEADAPKGLLPESVFTAVENKALNEGDVATIRDLASGKLTEQATTMGQRLRALAERDPESPVAAIQKIEDVRGGGSEEGTKAVKDMATELQKETAKAHPDVLNETSLTKLINSLRC